MQKYPRRMFARLAMLSIATFFPQLGFAGGYTPYVVPTMMEVVSGGIVVYGAFGNENSCTSSDTVLYSNTFVDYEVVVSMVLAAITSGREIRFYSDECVTFAFHGGTVNRARNGQAIYFR